MTDNSEERLSTWIRADDSRPYCARPWRQATILSDGTAVCACVDANATNPLGNLGLQSFDEIWNGPAYRGLRKNIAEGAIDSVGICRGCPNRIEGPAPPRDDYVVDEKPKALFIESYAGCNLKCPGCDREGIEGGRSDLTLDFDTYKKAIDALSPDLRYMEFHLGGENYMHKRAHEMVRYCRDNNPDCFILTSTNGHFFHTDERAEALVESGLDAAILSIDGATQETYSRYRVNGRLERVLDGIRRVVRARERLGSNKPLLIWRYILFHWNDSAEEMDLARRLAREVGVDHLTWLVNLVGTMESSKRYYVGSPHLHEIKDELWDTLPARLGLDAGIDLLSYPERAASAERSLRT